MENIGKVNCQIVPESLVSKSLKILESNPVKTLATFQGRVAVGWETEKGEERSLSVSELRGNLSECLIINMMVMWQPRFYPEEMKFFMCDVI